MENKKIDFDSVCWVFESLRGAFHPEGVGEDGPDAKFMALWHLFLVTANWTEDEFFAQLDEEAPCNCEECGVEEASDNNGEKTSSSEEKEEVVFPIKNVKPNFNLN